MPENTSDERKPYHAPELRVHGTVEDLTRFDLDATGDDSYYGDGVPGPPTSQ